MVGRKRKNVKRQPNGQPSRVRDFDQNLVARAMPHRQSVPASLAHDPKAECVLGRLCLNGKISETQYDAGVKYREAVMRYRSVISAPRGEVSMSGVIVGPWGGGSLMTDSRAVEIRDKYMEAFNALEKHPDGRCARDVSNCVVRDQMDFRIEVLRCGLNALAVHFGLTGRGKSFTAINAVSQIAT